MTAVIRKDNEPLLPRVARAYPSVVDNHERVKQVGLQKHLEEEKERARAGVNMMSHLERRYCKVVKLEEE